MKLRKLSIKLVASEKNALVFNKKLMAKCFSIIHYLTSDFKA